MRTNIVNLPGVVSIGWIYSFLLPKRVDLRAVVNEEIFIFADVNFIQFFGEPELTLKKSKENYNYFEEASLSFITATTLPKHENIAFIVRLVDGSCRLIGSAEQPGASVEYEFNAGNTSGQSRIYNYKVSHKALRTCIKVSASF